MSSARNEIAESSQEVMLDIEAEIRYWRECYLQRPFFMSNAKFEAYLPTLKFGYDTFLLNHHHQLEQLMPVLKERYENRVPAHDRIDWHHGESIVSEIWQRMRGRHAARAAAAMHSA